MCHLPCWECWDPSDLSDMDNINETIDNELLSLQTHGPGRVMVTYAVIAYGPSDACCSPASQGLVWQQLMVGTNIPRGVLPRRISWMIKSEWLLGWWIHTRMSLPSCLDPAISYGLGNCPLTFLNCHRVSD